MRNYVIAICCGIAALVLLATHFAYAQAVPDPIANPVAALGTLQKLYASGAFVDVGILVAFFGLSFASSRIAWLQTDHRAVYVSAILGGLTLLVAPAAQGTTPNLQMLVGAAVTVWALAQNPKKPAVDAVVRGDLPPVAAMPKAIINGGAGIVLLLALGLGSTQLMACGANASQQRQTALHAALVTTDTACATFVAYDLKHQEDLKASAHASGATLAEVTDTIAKWRAAREPALEACEVVYDAIKAGAKITDDHSIKAMTAAAGILADALRIIGVKL